MSRGPGGQFSLLVDRSASGAKNQDPGLAIAVLPPLVAHYPELLGTVYVAPVNALFFVAWLADTLTYSHTHTHTHTTQVNALFFLVWNVVRLFIRAETARRFVLIGGKEWREQLAAAVGGDVRLPAHMLPRS